MRRLMRPEDRKALDVPTVKDCTSKADLALERDLQKNCESELSRMGIAFLHLSPRAREKRGWPDLVFALSGRPIAVELKSPTGDLSEDQVVMLAQMKRNGWETYVIRDFDIFKRILTYGQQDMPMP